MIFLVVDVALIKALVNLVFDGFSPTKPVGRTLETELEPREQEEMEKDERMRNMITYSLGGLMGKQVYLLNLRYIWSEIFYFFIKTLICWSEIYQSLISQNNKYINFVQSSLKQSLQGASAPSSFSTPMSMNPSQVNQCQLKLARFPYTKLARQRVLGLWVFGL